MSEYDIETNTQPYYEDLVDDMDEIDDLVWRLKSDINSLKFQVAELKLHRGLNLLWGFCAGFAFAMMLVFLIGSGII